MTPVLQVGIDPAKRTCVAQAVDQSGAACGRAMHFTADREGVKGLLRRVEKLAPEAAPHFFIEASGNLWYAPAGLLREHGCPVSLINPRYTAMQRKSSSYYAKSDARDAEAIARAPFNMGEKATHPADIPEGPRLNLRCLCRHRYTLQRDATAIKLRVIAWLDLTTPGLSQILGTDLSLACREFVAKYPVVARAVKLGKQRLHDFLQRRSEDEIDEGMVDELFELARNAYSPRDFDDQMMARQIQMELRRLEFIEQQIAELDEQIDKLMPQCDAEGLARSITGFGPVIAPIMVAEAGTDVSRFAKADRFASWAGVVARASGTAGKQKEGLPMTKAGRSIVKWALYTAAKVAAVHDPELSAFYQRLRQKNKHYNTAINAVANKLARRYWAVMREQRPYEKRHDNTTEKPQQTA